MTEKQAIDLLEKVTGALTLTRQDHITVVEALTCIRKLVEQKETVKEDNNVE